MIANEQYQRLSNPQNNVKIMAAWEGFLSGHAPQANALRCLIDDSWRRCLAVQVDPARRQALPPVNEATLNSLQHQHCELLSAGPVLHASHSLSRRCESSVRHFTSHYNDAVESYFIKLLIRITYLLAIYEIIGMLLAIFGVRSDFVVSLPNVRLPTVELTAGGGI